MKGLILVLTSNVLHGRNFDFLGGYLVVTACYLEVIGGYYLLLVATACYRSLLLAPTCRTLQTPNSLGDKLSH